MPIDKAELATVLATDPEIEKIATEALTKKGFVIRDKAADTAFMDNYKRDVIEKEIPGEIAKVHSQYDRDIESSLGVKKDPNEKSYDFLKRAAKVTVDGLNGKISEYEKTIKEKGDPQGIWQKKIEDAETKARLAIEERDTRIKELSSSNEKATKSIVLQTSYGELAKNFKKDLPPMFGKLSQQILNETLAIAVLKDGKLYLGDGSGGIKKDASFKEIPIEDHLKAEFKDVIEEQRKQGGSGSGNGGGNPAGGVDPNTVTVDNFQMPSDVKTQDDLMSHLLKSGIPRGGEQFNKIWNKFALGQETVIENNKKVTKIIGKALPMY